MFDLMLLLYQIFPFLYNHMTKSLSSFFRVQAEQDTKFYQILLKMMNEVKLWVFIPQEDILSDVDAINLTF